MDAGFGVFTAHGTSDKGNKIKVQFALFNDPGYRDTARMVSEAAFTLLFDNDKIKVGGGFHTPASCLN